MNDNVLHRIRNGMDGFSKGQKRIANYILTDCDKASNMTACRLGQITQVSESTVVRFASQLGYDGYPAMQKALQELVRGKLTSLQRIEASGDQINSGDIAGSVMQQDMDTLRSTIDGIDRTEFDRVVGKLVRAKRIYILGVRSSSFLAGYLNFYFHLIFENVTLVGVLGADTSLYVDHYRAAERTFNLLTQVIGRAGRGSKAGRAVIQTYTPQNDVIQAAAQQDYQRFYDAEIRLRRLRRDPPFADQFTVTVTGQEETPVRRAIELLRQGIGNAAKKPPYDTLGIQVIGPAPAPVVKVNGVYRYRLLVLGQNIAPIRELLAGFMRAFVQRSENRRLHIYTDCDKMD